MFDDTLRQVLQGGTPNEWTDERIKLARTGIDLQHNVHKQAMDLVNATTTQHQRKQDFALRETHESHDYDIRMREQLRKDRELEARLARDVLDAAAPRAASAGKALHNSPSGSTLDTESSGRISLEMGAAARQWP